MAQLARIRQRSGQGSRGSAGEYQAETGIKTMSKKNKCKKVKWLSEEAIQISVKRREAKGKGEKGIYTHLNAESKE